MSIITRKTIRKGDDFKAIISLKDRNGSPLDATVAQFKFIYCDIYGNGYEVSYDGATRLNNYIDGDHLVAVFENYKLACGVLKREAWYWVDDPAFADGKWNYGDNLLSGIELTEQGGAKEVEETIEVPDVICVNETLVVSKGDPFRYDDFTTAQLDALKGETGNSGVYVGATPPTDGSVSIALDPSGDAYGEIPMGGKVGEVLTKTTVADYATAWSSPLRPLFVARGAVFNETTGFYELNGLTDITEAQMLKIYEKQDRLNFVDCSFAFAETSVRTHFVKTPGLSGYAGSTVNLYAAFTTNIVLEVVNMVRFPRISNLQYFARLCSKLVRVLALAPDPAAYTATSYTTMFMGCTSLEILEFKNVKFSLDLSDCSKLIRDSIVYMITNAANTSPITMTLHADAFKRLTQADIAFASSKNMTLTITA